MFRSIPCMFPCIGQVFRCVERIFLYVEWMFIDPLNVFSLVKYAFFEWGIDFSVASKVQDGTVSGNESHCTERKSLRTGKKSHCTTQTWQIP